MDLKQNHNISPHISLKVSEISYQLTTMSPSISYSVLSNKIKSNSPNGNYSTSINYHHLFLINNTHSPISNDNNLNNTYCQNLSNNYYQSLNKNYYQSLNKKSLSNRQLSESYNNHKISTLTQYYAISTQNLIAIIPHFSTIIKKINPCKYHNHKITKIRIKVSY